MVELDFSGDSRYKEGAEYTKYLLREISDEKDPETMVDQIKILAKLGTISEDVAKALTIYLTSPAKDIH